MLNESRSKCFEFPAAVPFPPLPGSQLASIAADIDGDGQPELLIVNVYQGTYFLGTVSHLKTGELSPLWDIEDDWGELVVLDTRISAIEQWTFGPADRFFMADLDGDGADEVVAFNDDVTIGVIKWNLVGDGGTKQWNVRLKWITSGAIPAQHRAPFSLSRGTCIYPADVDGDGSQELLLYDGHSKLAVAKWLNGSLEIIWSTSTAVPAGPGASQWNALPGDRFFVTTIERRQLIVAFDGHSTLGAFQWNEGGLQVLWMASGAISGPNNQRWTLSASDRLYPADVDLDGDQELFVHNGVAIVGVFKWGNGKFNLAWIAIGQLADPEGDTWTFTPNQSIHVLLTTEKFGAAIIVSDGAGKLATLEWSAVQGGMILLHVANTGFDFDMPTISQLVPVNFSGGDVPQFLAYDGNSNFGVIQYGITAVWSTSAIPDWNLNLVLAAPSRPFAAFSGDRLKLYNQFSNSVYPDSDGDIRSEYTNTDIPDGSFTSFGLSIAGQKWTSGSPYSEADWTAVQTILAEELQAVAPVRGMFGNMNDLAGKIRVQQDGDLAYCVSLADKTIPDNNSGVEFWTGQIIDAAIWGAGVIPEAKAVQVGIAVTASLFGSLLGSGGGIPESASYSDFKTTVDHAYLAATEQNGMNELSVLADAAKLSVTGQAASQAWSWKPTDSTDIAQSSQNANRIAFYQVVLPVKFQIVVFTDNPTPWPYGIAKSDAPWSYWSEAAGNGLYTVYLLCYPGTTFYRYYFPTLELMTDLLATLKVRPELLFKGQYGWKLIPRKSADDESSRKRDQPSTITYDSERDATYSGGNETVPSLEA